jgi:hypothetical protein
MEIWLPRGAGEASARVRTALRRYSEAEAEELTSHLEFRRRVPRTTLPHTDDTRFSGEHEHERVEGRTFRAVNLEFAAARASGCIRESFAGSLRPETRASG